MASERYSFSLTTFSPSGKLMQIEYALAAVASGAASVGLKAVNGVVLASEKKHKSILYDDEEMNKIEMITDTIGMVYSGMGPDYRLLVRRARKMAEEYRLTYGVRIPTAQLVQRVADVMQEFTQSGGVRPFGVSLLIAGFDNEEDDDGEEDESNLDDKVEGKGSKTIKDKEGSKGKPVLYQCDPSGAYFAWKATAMGKNFVNGKTFLERRYDDKLELEDAVHTAILTLKEGFEGQMSEDNIEIGICNEQGFKRFQTHEVRDYLTNIA